MRKGGAPLGSIEAFQAAMRLTPKSVPAWDGLSTAAEDIGDAPGMCDALRKIIELQPHAPSVRSALLYNLHYLAEMDAPALYQAHREWDRLFGQCDRIKHDSTNSCGGRLRIGYVSPDFRSHTVPRFIGAALRHHDRQRFEVFCYSDALDADATTDRLRGHVEHWRDIVGLGDDRAQQIITDDRIDILVDLRGHAAHNRMTLFTQKPAPVQLNMVGYFDTTGLSAMDYRVSDACHDPPGISEPYHTERLLRLPSCWCYSADEDAPDVTASFRP